MLVLEVVAHVQLAQASPGCCPGPPVMHVVVRHVVAEIAAEEARGEAAEQYLKISTGYATSAKGAEALLRRNLLIYGLGGIIVPFIGIKLIDLILIGLRMT